MLRTAASAAAQEDKLVQVLHLVAIICAAAFTGAAFYINFAEHPARMQLAPAAALTQWKPAYKAGFIMQSSLAVLAGVSAIAVTALGGGMLWAIGGVLLIANWPYTLAAILPLNNRLMAIVPEAADAAVLDRLRFWNRLHAGRTVLGAAGLACMVAAALNSNI